MAPYGITPTEVRRRLEGCDLLISERRLTDWRVRGWLPKLTRARPAQGAGPRAHYVWRDPDVVEQTLTLVVSLGLRGRLESARLLTWFSGFDYPIVQMRDDWADFEGRPWRFERRRALAGFRGSDEDALDLLKLEARATRSIQKLGVSKLFTDTYVRLLFDASYRPEAELTQERAQGLLGDLTRVFSDEAFKVLLPHLRPEPVPMIVQFLQDLHSHPRLVSLIRGLSDSELETVHRDCRFFLGPYRALLRDAIMCANTGEARDRIGLWMVPRLSWRVGRYLMLLDIALRRRGLGRQLDATVGSIHELVNDPENRALLAQQWQVARPLMAGATGDPAQGGAQLDRLLASAPGHERLQDELAGLAEDLKTIWGPTVIDLKALLLASPERQ